MIRATRPLVAQWAIVAVSDGRLRRFGFTPAAEIVDLSFLGEFGKVLLWLVASVAIVALVLGRSCGLRRQGTGGCDRDGDLSRRCSRLGLCPLIRDSDFVTSLLVRAQDSTSFGSQRSRLPSGVTARLVVPRQVGVALPPSLVSSASQRSRSWPPGWS